MQLRNKSLSLVGVVVSLVSALTLSGCASPNLTPVAPTITDAWVKAVPALMDGMAMTGVFMTVENSTDEELFLTSATSDTAGLTETPLEVHEVVKNDAGEMVMQAVEGSGIPIPAHSSVTLKPGGYHVMFWDLLKTIPVGSTVDITVNFSNGTSVAVEAVAREIANAQEKYAPETGTEEKMNME